MDPKDLSDDQLLDHYEESRREPGAALLAGCFGMIGGWTGAIVFYGAKGLILAVLGTLAWVWAVNRAEAARQRALLASPLPKALCERGLAAHCSLDYLIYRAARGEDGATADRPQIILKGRHLPNGPVLAIRALLDRAGPGRLETDRTPRDLTPDETRRLLEAHDAFVADPRAGERHPVTDGVPCDLLTAGKEVHVAVCNLADPKPDLPVHRLALLLSEIAKS